MFDACYVLFGVCRSLCGLLLVVRGVLFVVYCWLCVARLLFVGGCLLFGVWRCAW